MAASGLRHIVITPVDRDGVRDGGAGHFAAFVRVVRGQNPATPVEILGPDFRGRMNRALDALARETSAVTDRSQEAARWISS